MSYNRNENKRGNGNNTGYNSSRKNFSDKFTKLLWIENRFIGKIIGKGGANIKQLERETEARVQVTNQCDGNKTLIKVMGSIEATNKAHKVLEKIQYQAAPLIPKPAPVIIETPQKSPPKKDYFDLDEC
ncbi:hypothetical protein GWI33_011753, partial [Rhynchophorus ferrugineus]